jgi:hypothetical protein
MTTSTTSNRYTSPRLRAALTALVAVLALLAVWAPGAQAQGWGPIKPFITNITECPGGNSFPQDSGGSSTSGWKVYHSESPPITGCGGLPFDPRFDVVPTSSRADSPTGLEVQLHVPQNPDPFGLATAHLRDAIVTLPEGMTVNPSAGNGLEGCTDEQVGMTDPHNDPPRFNNQEPRCPPGSKIGTVEVYTPLLDTPEGENTPNLRGEAYLGTPNNVDPTSGEMFRLFFVVRNEERGLLVKLYGSSVADPQTGRLTTSFFNNPELPFSRLWLHLEGGPDAPLATPRTCGTYDMSSKFIARTEKVVRLTDTATFDEGCGNNNFAPTISGGSVNPSAGVFTPFHFTFLREDGQHELRNISVSTPPGLLGSIRGVPLCPEAEAQTGRCPDASQIGTVSVGAGPGPEPYFVQGKVFLSGAYNNSRFALPGQRGATDPTPYGLVIAVRAVAGPFDLGMVVVRQSIHVNPSTAELNVVSDPVPTILSGIPLRVRRIDVKLDRPDFMLTPTSCAQKSVDALLTSKESVLANASFNYQVSGCESLPFDPQMQLELVGRRHMRDGGHPGIRAVVTQQAGEANISGAEVRLPLSIALDAIRAAGDWLCEYDDGQRGVCPASSIIGTARAESPLLNEPLTGPVYFVKHVRFHPVTGNRIRTLPTLLIPLRGEISINVRATSDTDQGKLVNTFDTVPDARLSRFELNLRGGRRGILVVTSDRDVCARPTRMERFSEGENPRRRLEATFRAHSGKVKQTHVDIKTPCRKPGRLKVRKASWKGNRIALAGVASRGAAKRLRVSVTCGRTRITKQVKARRGGAWRTRLRARGRCRDASTAQLTATYPGDKRFEPLTVEREIRKS